MEDHKSTNNISETLPVDENGFLETFDSDGGDDSDDMMDEEEMVKLRNMRAQRMAEIQEKLNKEAKIKTGIESLLQMYANKHPNMQAEVQLQLNDVNCRIEKLTHQFEQLRRMSEPGRCCLIVNVCERS